MNAPVVQLVASTLAERLQWILKERGFSQRGLSTQTGLAPGHVGVLMMRLRRDPNAGVETDTLRRIADGSGVSYEWLATGEGTAPTSPRRPVEPAARKADDLATLDLLAHALTTGTTPALDGPSIAATVRRVIATLRRCV